MSVKKPKLETVLANFHQLTEEEKAIFLRQVNQPKNLGMPVTEFNEWHQKNYGCSIEFSEVDKTGPDHSPVISITLFTKFGEFSGSGKNQKEAKANAVALAMKELS